MSARLPGGLVGPPCRAFEDRLLAALVAERPAASLLLDPRQAARPLRGLPRW
jgi:hypothetical protein